jgi:hypothetical protein
MTVRFSPSPRALAIAACSSMMILAGAPVARAQSAADQQACQFDAQTFCQAAIPDHGKVYRCLQRNKSRISAACRAAISRSAAPRRGRPG